MPESSPLIFTDLDGTLLDGKTYSWEAALPALEECRRRNVQVIPVSSKTAAELRELMSQMGLRGPFVSENGGGIFWPATGTQKDIRMDLGRPYQEVRLAFTSIRARTGWPLTGFGDLDSLQVVELTGLSPEQAELCRQRDFDEPFTFPGAGPAELARLNQLAAECGLRVTRGGRFLHLFGGEDKGRAVKILTDLWRARQEEWTGMTIGLGDSSNDLSLLKAVDIPIWVGSGPAPAGAEVYAKGPGGWNRAVMNFLKTKTIL